MDEELIKAKIKAIKKIMDKQEEDLYQLIVNPPKMTHYDGFVKLIEND